MGSFNPINLIINTIGITAAGNAQNQNNGANNNSALAANSSNSPGGANQTTNTGNSPSSFGPINYSSAQNNAYTGQTGLSAVNQTIISTVEIEQRANYIKDLLNLPRDFEALINQIQGGTNPNIQALKDLSKLLQNGKINLTALSSLLSDNSKEAIQKLMMTIMTVSKMGSNNVNQLKELIGMFSTANASVDSAQTVKNILMLYLPWLPLSVRNSMNLDFDIDIFDKIQGADPNETDGGETIKIMIQTANFGNIMADLELALNNEVNVYITASENFPEKEVFEKFNKENKKTNIRTNVTIEKNKDSNKLENMGQNVQIASSDYVSPKLILAAHSLIKTIIDIDSQEFIINEETEG